MADTQRTLSALLTLFANNASAAISPQDARDVIVSACSARVTRTVTTDVSLTTDDEVVLVDISGGVEITITLPDAATCAEKVFTVKRLYGSVNVIIASAGDTIDGAASLTIGNNWMARTVISDGTNWYCDVREDW